jgi:hypothetical protein
MAEPDQNGQRYEVHCSGFVASSIYQLQAGASPKKKKLIAVAFRRIVEKLQINPTGFGEPLYRLPNLRMQVRSAVVPPLGIIFAVCEDRPLVVIKSGRLLGAP